MSQDINFRTNFSKTHPQKEAISKSHFLRRGEHRNETISNSEETDDSMKTCNKKILVYNVNNFLSNSSLHGLKYIANRRITICERVFFALSFIAVIIVSFFFISNLYSKWSASPIIITISSRQTLATSIPFPAVTICSLNKARKSHVANIRPATFNHSLLTSLCGMNGELSDVSSQFFGTWKHFKVILTEVAQPCEDMLLYCHFGSKNESCMTLFSTILTDDGLCCIFNGLHPMFLLRNYTDEERFDSNNDDAFAPIDWTPEKGYEPNLPKNFYPRTAGGIGSRMGLTVILNSSSSEYFCSTSKSFGFKILIHSPAELPKIRNYGFLITPGREVRISIEPKYQNAVPEIRAIKKNIRRCLFSDEGDLTFYRTYSRKNCELECEAKIFLDNCDCILYYLPKIDPSVRICGLRDNKCTTRIQSQIESSNQNLSCERCLPGCFELTYQSTVTSAKMTFGNFYSNGDFHMDVVNNSNELNDIAIVHFYYLANRFWGTTKSEMFGLTEFLSNIGGLLGLFMGFSIFSLIEIVYFITLRPHCASYESGSLRGSSHQKNEPRRMKKITLKRKSFEYKVKKHARSRYQKSLQQILEEQNKLSFLEAGVFTYIE